MLTWHNLAELESPPPVLGTVAVLRLQAGDDIPVLDGVVHGLVVVIDVGRVVTVVIASVSSRTTFEVPSEDIIFYCDPNIFCHQPTILVSIVMLTLHACHDSSTRGTFKQKDL